MLANNICVFFWLLLWLQVAEVRASRLRILKFLRQNKIIYLSISLQLWVLIL